MSCTTFSDSKSDSQIVKPIKKIPLKKLSKTSAKKKTFNVKLNRIHMRKSRVHCIIDVTPKTGYKNPLVTKKIFKTSNYLRVKCWMQFISIIFARKRILSRLRNFIRQTRSKLPPFWKLPRVPHSNSRLRFGTGQGKGPGNEVGVMRNNFREPKNPCKTQNADCGLHTAYWWNTDWGLTEGEMQTEHKNVAWRLKFTLRRRLSSSESVIVFTFIVLANIAFWNDKVTFDTII